MSELINEGIIQFSEASASKDPVPGGGGVSALAGSLAASLAEMVTNLTIGKKKFLEYTEELTALKEEADSLRKQLLECIQKDADAFAPLAAARHCRTALVSPHYFHRGKSAAISSPRCNHFTI